MVLSPQDIHNKEFSVKMRGYNIDQVNDFLDQIIKDYQITIKQNDDLRGALHDTQTKLKQLDDQKNSLNRTLLLAQRAADGVESEAKQKASQLLNESNQKADQIVQEANERANEIVSQAVDQARNLSSEIQTLKKSTNLFRQKVLALLQSQLDFTNSENWDQLLAADHEKSINDTLKNLDKQRASSVESNQDSRNQNIDPTQTVVFYPDGSVQPV